MAMPLQGHKSDNINVLVTDLKTFKGTGMFNNLCCRMLCCIAYV